MTAPKRKRTVYSDEQKAAALAVLAAEGGNLRRAAKIAGVPYSSLKDWRNSPMPASPKVIEEATGKLDTILEQMATRLAHGLNKPEALAKLLTRPAQAGVLMGITVDKLIGLRKGATDESKMSLSDFLSQAKWIEDAVSVRASSEDRADRPAQRPASARSTAHVERPN